MVTATAPQPSRATTSITFALGPTFVIHCSVFTGVEETRVKRSEFVVEDDALVPVGRSPIRKDTGEVIDSAAVVRMAQADNEQWVVLTDDEIADCTTDRGMAEVVCFVPNAKVNQYLVQDVKQVRPKKEKGKANPAVERAFLLLLAGLKARKVHALVQVAMRGPARYALLDCEGNLFLIASADQVRQAIPVDEVKFPKAQVDMMGALIDAVGVDTPVLADETAPKVQAFVNSKATGAAPPVRAAIPEAAGDIMALLEQSIQATKGKKGVAA